MQNIGPYPSEYGVERHGIQNANTVYWHMTTPMFYEQIVRRREGEMLHLGPVVVRTGDHTGRSPNDKFIVKEPTSEKDIWWGDVNRSINQEQFDYLLRRIQAYLQNRDIFVFDGYAGADERYQMPVRVITEYAWHSLFARNMFRREFKDYKLKNFKPDFTVIDVPQFHADPQFDGTNSQTFILVDFGKKLVLIGGTAYSGEIKKSIFTAMNYYLPTQGVLSMHCSANYGSDKDDVALFFGLSGTGKTTLSNDPERILVGDDEHGWSDDGIFNFEGGCYAKVIRLSPEGEPDIYRTTRRFGTILENVAYDPLNRRVDLDDDTLTENTRASYPITHVSNSDRTGVAGHPKDVIFLTADAFGVMPPISKLTRAQAMYHFLSGYTAKVAGTERGVTEPQATFSACFGAPFMPLHPNQYAQLLGEKIDQHNSKVWLINTGWTGGPFGVGNRMKLAYTRQMVTAALAGALDEVETYQDPFFGLQVPTNVDGVPNEVLRPRSTWSDGQAYDDQAADLARMFKENFEQFAQTVSSEVREAGPK
ncbi:MAG: phosphoenolpyruvate carboxykinase (ATP) [Anaerolineae bacterium]|nr:MAG: phosphoenolpyruvate carboxykinase (ATP) [Anaerolineae bacterium]